MCWAHPSFTDPDKPYIDKAERKYYAENPDVDRDTKIMEPAVFRALVDDAAALGTRAISILGRGEPLLNPCLSDMVAAVKRSDMCCVVSTNGILLTRDCVRDLAAAGLDDLKISVNAASEETYREINRNKSGSSLEQIVETASFVREEKKRRRVQSPRVSLSFIIMNINCHEVADMARMAVRCDADEISFSLLYAFDTTTSLLLSEDKTNRLLQDLGAVKVDLDRLGIRNNITTLMEAHNKRINERYPTREYYRQHPCYAGWIYSVVMADGTVNPCYQCFMKMGNIKETGFLKIWNSQAYEDFRERTVSLPSRGGKMAECLCDNCCFVNRNADMHRLLTPFRRHSFCGSGFQPSQ